MKVLGQIVTVQPLGLVVSLPNQLLGHVPITNITSQLTAKLEKLDEDAERGSDVSMDNDVEAEESLLPNLEDLFKPGQYVRAVIMAVHSQGTSFTGLASKSRDGNEKNSRRVELSLVPEKVNVGIAKADLKTGMVCSPISSNKRRIEAFLR
jgi:rRNA biogenesis protein RRP5